jgi:hypothetical protein
MQVTQSIGQLLGTIEGKLQHLLAQASFLQQLNETSYQCLPTNLAAHCLVANIRGNRLILHTDSAAHATLLRYHVPLLIEHLQRHHGLPNLCKATIKVRPLPSSPSTAPKQSTYLTPATAALLRMIASRAEDPQLKAAFLRLARRTPPKSPQNHS